MKTTQIWYSVRNGGDGSAYPTFMESKAQAELDQDHMDEGWGESCTGSITIEHEGEISCSGIETIKDQITELEEDLEWSPENKKHIEALKELL